MFWFSMFAKMQVNLEVYSVGGDRTYCFKYNVRLC